MIFLYELKKTWGKRRGILLLILALAAKIITVFYRTDTAYLDQPQEQNKGQFLQYMQVLEGALTPEKAAYLAAQEAYFLEAQSDFDRANAEYAAGRITKYDWVTAVAAHEAIGQQEAAFAAIRGQYAHVQDDPRCGFLYTNGWSAWLARDTPDLILVLLLVLLTVPVICAEGGMEPVLNAAPNGGMRLRCAKLLNVFVSAAAVTVLFFCAEFICISRRYGLPAADSALQSLPQFYNSEWELTLRQAALVTLLNRLLGALETAAICFAAALLTRQPIPSMLSGLLAVLLPGVIWNQQEAYGYILPLPAGMLRAAGFLKTRFSVPGTEFESTAIVSRLPVTDISLAEYGRTVFLVIAVTAVLCTFGIVYALPHRRVRFLPLCIMCMLLTGCGANGPSDARFNSIAPCRENAEYTLTENDGFLPVLSPKNGGGDIPLIRDPFPAESSYFQVKSCYLTEDAAFRMEEDGAELRVVRTDLCDFSEKLLCTVPVNRTMPETMLGLDANFPHADASGFANGRCFFVDGNRIIIETHDGIFLVQNGRIRQIIAGSVGSWCCENGVIWYTDRVCRVHKYLLGTGTDEIPDFGFAEEIALTEDGLLLHGMDSIHD